MIDLIKTPRTLEEVPPPDPGATIPEKTASAPGEAPIAGALRAAEREPLVGLLHAERALRWLLPLISANPRPVCPRCDRTEFRPGFLARWWSGAEAQCPTCRRAFNWRHGTPFSGSSWTPGAAALLIFALAGGVPTVRLARWLGVTRGTIRVWRDRVGVATAPRAGAGTAEAPAIRHPTPLPLFEKESHP